MNIRHYLSKEWSVDYNCWSLVQDVYQTEYGVEFPDVPIDAEDIRGVMREFAGSSLRDQFEKIDAPVDGCLVEMGEAGRARHVGVFYQGRILHNYYQSGVVFERDPPIPVIAYYAARFISS